MAKLAELRQKAKALGISKAQILTAKTPAELQDVIDSVTSTDGTSSTPRKKSAVKKAAAEAQRAAARKKTKTSKSASSTSVPAESPRGRQAKRPTTASNGDSGRFTLANVNFSSTMYDKGDGWNPREGSPPDQIIKAVKRNKGDRDAVYAELAPRVDEFVTPKKRDGTKRTKAEKLVMLRYRISRTMWEFATRTGQHESSGNRVEYGEGGTGQGLWKPAAKRKKAQTARKPTARKPAARKTPTRRPTTTTARQAGRSKPKPRARAGKR